MISKIIFNGKSSEDFGILVEQLPNAVHAGRRGETYTIPGRSGSRVREEKAYANYSLAYKIWFRDRLSGRDVYQLSSDIAAWLLTALDYCRFEDSYEPEIYRLARYAGPLDVETPLRTAGKAVLEFDFQPKRFLRTGETEIELTQARSTLYNPTIYAAEPLIRVDMALEGITEGEPVEPVDVVLEMQAPNYIANSMVSADDVHRVIPYEYGTGNAVSQQIDVSGYQTAIISAISHRVVKPESGSTTYIWGSSASTCYTFLDADGDPVSGITDHYEMDSVRVPIPRNAKYMYICCATAGGAGSEQPYSEPALTLIPTPPRVGTGKVSVNGKTSTIRFTDRSTVYLDCEAHNAYYADGSNANAAVTHKELGNPFPTFPTLDPGENLVSVSGEGVSATISPRWWRL